ncbi:phosphatase PAP2 family protein [Nocardioides sp.]|uniref:phosphatase PAP2 family protein n=1 Tax=Nocardioides sp. TaxID=35761 RepID=UPI002734BB31|nr:phosphatase PAP2 family protein [Nocardioides sp.]MDP3894993.1 phosphatase PAP2 family protein [Nocardioides sp.]
MTNRLSRRSRWLFLAGQALVVLLAVFTYFRVRNLTEGSREVAIEHAHDLVELERALGIYIEPDVQEPFTSSATLGTIANSVYIYGHWPVIAVVMIWTVWRHRAVFQRLRDGMLISGFIGMFIFATYPLAPPRLASLGLTDTVTERTESYRILQPPQFTNQYAAMPSLHAGWDLLVGMAIVSATGLLAVKAIGYVLPILMTIAVVVTGNHFVLDVVAGVALALLGHALAAWPARRRERRAETHARSTPEESGDLVQDRS